MVTPGIFSVSQTSPEPGLVSKEKGYLMWLINKNFNIDGRHMVYIRKTIEPVMFYKAIPETFEKARMFRKKMTRYEKLLWQRLRRKTIHGLRIRRQHPIEYYIADFYCHEIRLVIELDGPIHKCWQQKEHDENRTAEFDRFGIEVIRFNNQDIVNRIGWVIAEIKKKIEEKLLQKK